jgi:hypothetical protein
MRFFHVAVLGMIGIAVLNTANADLVTNGSFNINDGVGTSVGHGWTNTDGSIVIDQSFAAPADVYDASFTGTGTLSQPLGTVAGTNYTLSFSLLDDAANVFDQFVATFGGYTTPVITGDQAGTYQPEVFTVPAADLSGGDILSFTATPGFTNAGDWHLDDVSVTAISTNAIPEPVSVALLATGVLAGTLMKGRRRRR